MQSADLYHRGIVVVDLPSVKAWFTEHLGYRWCEEFSMDLEVITPQGQRTIPLHMAYSMDEPRLELVAAVPGTVWAPADSGVHHLGYWSDDVDADAARLVAEGAVVEVGAPGREGGMTWCYVMTPIGVRLELVSRSLEPVMREWFTTGRNPMG